MRVVLTRCFFFSLILAPSLCTGQTPELVVQTGHSSEINSVAFSPDGRLLASGSVDWSIKLWDVRSGSELRMLKGHSGDVESLAFSPDGKLLASASSDETIKLWDVISGNELQTLKGHSSGVLSVAFSPDGKLLASAGPYDMKLWDVRSWTELRTLEGSGFVIFSPDGKLLAGGNDDDTIKLWNVASGSELHTLKGHSYGVLSVAFSPDGKLLASGSEDETIKLWEVTSGSELRTLNGHSGSVDSVMFSPDGKLLVSGSSDIKLWDVRSGRELRTLSGHSVMLSPDGKILASGSGHTGTVSSVAFSPDGRLLASGSEDSTIKLWDVHSGSELRTLQGHSESVESVVFSPDGRLLASGGYDNVKLWDVRSGTELRTLEGHSIGVELVAFSPDGKLLASSGEDDTIKLWDTGSWSELRTLKGHSSSVYSVAFSPDGKLLASGTLRGIKLWEVDSGSDLRTLEGESDLVSFSPDGKLLASLRRVDGSIKLWNVGSWSELRTLKGDFLSVYSVAFSRDGRLLASGSGNYIRLWDVASGSELNLLRGHSSYVYAVAFSRDGKLLASGSADQSIKLWDVASGRELRTLNGHSDLVRSVAFSPDGEYLISGSSDTTMRVWETTSWNELARLIAIDQKDWLVTHPSGRFDASRDAQKLMSWRVGSGIYDLVALVQLKERYYEPGLLTKIFAKKSLRDVNQFANPKLDPEVRYEPLTKGSSTLTVTLTNRGGGIGRVQVFVNGKEYLADARNERLKQNPNVPQSTLSIDLSKATGVVAGQGNDVRVVAWNVENYISSRGAELAWARGGPTDRAPPEVYAIIGGISTYDGDQLNLNFAAKDAVDIANAIELGAKRLFGADKVHLTLLTTADDKRALLPTKANFNKAFTEARNAKPFDILIVYLAGHGIALQSGNSTYYYLTKEARSTDSAVLSDPAVRGQTTITSEELTEWVKQIPALKQLVILDTCAAGAAQAQLKLVDKREASGDATRALDRTKDRTGSYILMGSAADAPSYEASQYGQGVLTYALLKGMNGPALREDAFVDVSRLFQYARDEVEQLAKNIGGIQKPVIFSPKDDSFDVGQLSNEDRQQIKVASPKPMILRPRFSDVTTGDDTLDLMKLLRARLRDESFVASRGSANQTVFIFVDDDDFPGGIRPTGTYMIEGDKITINLFLRRDGTTIGSFQLVGSKQDVAVLAADVMKTLKDAVRKL